MIYKPGFTFSL